jgi:hypothetical protein
MSHTLKSAALVACALLGVAGTPAASQVVRGVLVDEHTGDPIAQGRILLLDEDRDSVGVTLTTDEGFFQLAAPQGGTYSLFVDGFGYWSSLIGPMELEDEETRIVEARVAARPIPVEGVRVETFASEVRLGYLVLNGFYDRLTSERGEFITPGEVLASRATYIQQLFHGKRSTRVFEQLAEAPVSARSYAAALWEERRLRSGTAAERRTALLREMDRNGSSVGASLGPWGNVVTLRRPGGGYCAPWLFVDGVRVLGAPGENLSDIVPVESVLAVEIYRAPFEGSLPFRDISRCECGVLAVWTNKAQ